MIVRVSLCASVLLLMCSLTFGDEAASKAKSNPVAKPTAAKPAVSKPAASKPAKKAAPKAAKKTPSAKKAKPVSQPKVAKKASPKGPKKLELLAIEKNIAAYTNQRRAQHGLQPLQIDENLVKSARNHAIWMARSRRLQHTSQPVAENIAMGYSSSQGVVQGWMNSSGHRANILNGGYRRIGTAAYETADGTIYWCQQFLR